MLQVLLYFSRKKSRTAGGVALGCIFAGFPSNFLKLFPIVVFATIVVDNPTPLSLVLRFIERYNCLHEECMGDVEAKFLYEILMLRRYWYLLSMLTGYL